jgi:hypothetical protein
MSTLLAATRSAAAAMAESPLNYVQPVDLSAAALGSGATFTSPVIDLSAVPGFSRWRVLVSSDQAGTVSLQQSADGVTFYTTRSGSYSPGQAAVYESLVAARYLQVTYVNGGSAQGSFRVLAALVAV